MPNIGQMVPIEPVATSPPQPAVTNPVATVYFKTLLALMTRNAIILSPHPGAKACCADAARMMAEAAKAAGAPDGVIQVLDEPNIPLIEKLGGLRR